VAATRLRARRRTDGGGLENPQPFPPAVALPGSTRSPPPPPPGEKRARPPGRSGV